ncbi:pimeloyl-ACP methyl ester carboxylesterase [Geodermatophilus bullaregiensis]|uniref:alpha/beta hydrolase n=1 Tax=Geodermatophilus bullaregiensis TaxID=1564160 RepID=UPI001959F902|nr:alpha/beta hydrolase [Geodermatophilus bullaregiensis]MBM7806506.1 pimeloyl-ACP methyl ester carboxylesterase [Geodermatophilus bullaregiensis]
MTEVRDPVQISVPVDGGELSALHWAADAPGAPIAVLVHGITANAMAWARVAAALAGEFEVVAPDLRGRAGSAGLPGPYGLERHAADVAVVLDRFGADGDTGADATVLVGHSMGAFVAAMAAAGPARDRVHGLVLVDGGLALPEPPGADLDAKLSAVLGPALDRLAMTFPDLAAVRAFWARHPAVGPWVDVPSVAAYLARDLVPGAEPLRSACVPEAVRVDGGDVLLNERVLEATGSLPVPATLLWARRGLLDQTPGLYDEVRLAGLGLESAGITAREVPDTNHYSVLWADQGVAVVAEEVRAAAAR